MEERNMKGKLFVLLVGMALLVGMLSGCVETPEEPEEPENQAPTADFTFSIVNTTVTFEDASTDTDGNITFWTWTFGDGETSTDQNPGEYTYDEDNTTYTVMLTVDDDGGATDTITKDVTVGTPPVPPTAAFNYEPTVNITVNETITFTDNSTAGSVNITSWLWDFGDETNSTEQNPEHNYTAIGSYTVTLTVTDENELSGTTEEITIEVIEAEEA